MHQPCLFCSNMLRFCADVMIFLCTYLGNKPGTDFQIVFILAGNSDFMCPNKKTLLEQRVALTTNILYNLFQLLTSNFISFYLYNEHFIQLFSSFPYIQLFMNFYQFITTRLHLIVSNLIASKFSELFNLKNHLIFFPHINFPCVQQLI